jgi:hypothetical protein
MFKYVIASSILAFVSLVTLIFTHGLVQRILFYCVGGVVGLLVLFGILLVVDLIYFNKRNKPLIFKSRVKREE